MTFVAFVVLRVFCFRDLNLEEREDKKKHRTDVDYTDITCKKSRTGGEDLKKVQQKQRGLFLIL